MNFLNGMLCELTGYYVLKEADLAKSLQEDHPIDTMVTFCPSQVMRIHSLAVDLGFLTDDIVLTDAGKERCVALGQAPSTFSSGQTPKEDQ